MYVHMYYMSVNFFSNFSAKFSHVNAWKENNLLFCCLPFVLLTYLALSLLPHHTSIYTSSNWKIFMFTLTFTFNNRRVAYLWIRNFLFAFNYELFLCQISGHSHAHRYIHIYDSSVPILYIWRHKEGMMTVHRSTRTPGRARLAFLVSVCIEHAVRLGGLCLFFSVITIVGTLFIAQFQWLV